LVVQCLQASAPNPRIAVIPQNLLQRRDGSRIARLQAQLMHGNASDTQ
jgi:hypothetical protein